MDQYYTPFRLVDAWKALKQVIHIIGFVVCAIYVQLGAVPEVS